MKLSKRSLKRLILQEINILNEESTQIYTAAMAYKDAVENAKEFNLLIDEIKSQFNNLQYKIIELLNSKFMDSREGDYLFRGKSIEDGSGRNIMKKDFKRIEKTLNMLKHLQEVISSYEVTEEQFQYMQSQIEGYEKEDM